MKSAAVVFHCGAKLECRREALADLPVGARVAVYFTRAQMPIRVPERDGRKMSCLMNCPAPVRKSGYQVKRVWGEGDESETPGYLVTCRVMAHEVKEGDSEA